MEAYIAKYGYVGVVIGTFLEGETTVLLGGIFSRLGYLSLLMVMLAAFIGTLLGDSTFFTIGRFFGKRIIERFEIIHKKVPLANKVIKKYGNFIIFTIRFLVGIRAVVLILLGCTNIRKTRFFIYSLLNAAVWSVFISVIGFLFSHVVFVFVTDIKRHEKIIVPAVLAIVIMLILVYRHIVKEKVRKVYGDQ